MGTIYEIAKIVGCSPSTVSKAFRGYTDIGEETKERIYQVANELGYKSKNYSCAKYSASKIVAVIYDDWRGFEHPFFTPVLNSARERLEREGYDILIMRRNPPNELEQIFRDRQIDGILLISSDHSFDLYYRQILKKFPLVSLDEVFVEEYSVLSDNLQGIRKAMEHLIRCGHRKIAMITGELNRKSAKERFNEYKECLSENKIRFSKKYIETCQYYSYDEGQKKMEKLLEKGNPSAVLVTGDEMCMGAVDYALKAGYKVPEDISFVGFDDIEYAKRFKPALTTVRQNKKALGTEAADLLIKLMNGKKPHKKRYLIDTQLIIRESTTTWKGN